jgi:hypothetical protein
MNVEGTSMEGRGKEQCATSNEECRNVRQPWPSFYGASDEISPSSHQHSRQETKQIVHTKDSFYNFKVLSLIIKVELYVITEIAT